ncbi:hypothetical protein [Cupriavidus basilensis]|uniref:Secretion system X translation initiation factor n=1 Tax=Cupriavidus basilensis TaxID=68895 RepID=A0A643FLL7_9BURK|nr:hypothetical protein [Cupriavidus basilensis]QOT79446.1 hypothetical protein F7R26_032510 [Cupriavidus basilensis]
MKPRLLILGGALAITVVLAILANRDPAGAVVAAVERGPASAQRERPTAAVATAQAPGPATDAGPAEIAALRDRNELLGGDAQGPASLFASHNWTPAPPPPPPAPVVAGPPPTPTAPPLPFTYLGKKLENGKWEAYLARGGETYVVHEQSVLDGQYRAEAITSNTLTLTYLPLRQTQRLAIGGE